MGIKIQTIKDIRNHLSAELNSLYPDGELRAIGNLIIFSVLGIKSQHQLYLNDVYISETQAGEIIRICRELLTGKPIQYILGETTFFGCRIKVDSSTLIPRQETEELVDLIIRENRNFRGSVTDLGTGSGCVAIALAVNLPFASVIATDFSHEALKVAMANGELNHVEVRFLEEDILDTGPDALPLSGIIVSNPPYVRQSEMAIMHCNIVDFEPHTALFVSDSDPLLYYRAILMRIEKSDSPEVRFYFEINEASGAEMISLVQSFGITEASVIKDINGKDRIVKGIRYVRH